MVWPPSSDGAAGKNMQLTTVIEREGDGYVALCPQLDIASQGDTAALARGNLKEALELFFETADSEEVSRRLQQRGMCSASGGGL